MAVTRYHEDVNNRFFEIIQTITAETEKLQTVIANHGRNKTTWSKNFFLSKRHKDLARLKKQKRAQRRILYYLRHISWR